MTEDKMVRKFTEGVIDDITKVENPFQYLERLEGELAGLKQWLGALAAKQASKEAAHDVIGDGNYE